MISFLYRIIIICIILILFRNASLYLNKEYPPLNDNSYTKEYRYYHTDYSALCADGVTRYGKCSKKADK